MHKQSMILYKTIFDVHVRISQPSLNKISIFDFKPEW